MARDNSLELELEGKEVEYIPLQVSSGILLHIGAGIYSSVAGAIKELVSNAYDADASRVTISTNYPEFNRIKVTDNGTGMTTATLAKAMSSIGSSLKRELNPKGFTPKFKRPVIGHLGIGLMALSQICTIATIESQVRDAETRFVAKIDFSAIRDKSEKQRLASTLEILQEEAVELKGSKGKLDFAGKAELSVGKDAEKIAKQRKMMLPEGEHLGYCMIYQLPAIRGREGTTLTLDPLDPAVIDSFNDLNRDLDGLPKKYIPDAYKTSASGEERKVKGRNAEEETALWQERRDRVNSYDWRDLCEALRLGQLSYAVLPQYHQFLWQLAMMSPVRYFDDGPVLVESVLRDKRKELEQFNFSLVVDNRELRKPVLLPSGAIGKIPPSELVKELDYFVNRLNREIDIDVQRKLHINGYIFWQRSQVTPSTLRGIEIYIRNVGIGLYDSSLLNFSTVNPTSRAGQMSGEIYVESGLEGALNVDRNSFRETDLEFLALQDYVWRQLGSTSLGDGILGKSVTSYFERRKIKDKAGETKHLADLRERVHRIADSRVEVEFSRSKSEQWFSEEGKRKLVVYLNSSDWPRNIAERHRAQKIIVPLKVALMLGNSADELFSLLEEILL